MAKSTKTVQLDQDTLDECKVVHSAWNELTRTWTLPTIHALGLKEPVRFNDLKRRIGNISATSLAERLSRMEEFGLVQRKAYLEVPARVEYSLTVKGHELHKILGTLADWSTRWYGKDPNSREFVISK